MTIPSSKTAAVALFLFAITCTTAQTQIWEECNLRDSYLGEAAGDQFGWVGVNAGDVDGDGVNDVVVGAPGNDAGALNAGRAYVYSGSSGVELFSFSGSTFFERVGTDVAAAGDVDGDGFGDVIVGAPATGGNPGRAYVLRGPDGSLLHTLASGIGGDAFGSAVSSTKDLDGDGCDDLIVGAPNDDTAGANAGRAYVYSGSSGAPIRSHDGLGAGDNFGSSVGFVMDRDHDGSGDYLVGAFNAGAAGAGQAYVFSGLNGGLDCTLDTDATGVNFGLFFSGFAGDVNADGEPDFFVADWGNTAPGPSTGRVFVYSGVDCSEILVLTGDRAGAGFGIGRGWAGDYDGDGHDDLFFGSWLHPLGGPGAGRGEVRSGLDGSLLASFTGDVDGSNLGFDAAGLGDIDGDGVGDFVLTAASHANSRGAAYTVTGAPELPRSYCDVVPNSAGPGATIGFRNSLSIAAAEFELTVQGAVPGQTAVFFSGEHRAQIPFGDGVRCVTGSQLFRLGTIALDASGAGSQVIDFAQSPMTPRSTWYFQCWFRDPAAMGAGFNASDGLRVRFCP